MKKRVVIGLSGGVDSSVAAALLIEQGYDVVGMYMRNWHDNTVVINNECPWIDDSNDAMEVAEHLGIPFKTIDLSKEYKERIVDYMFAEYKNGRTPNPDILCNREIKFDVFLKACLDLDADFVATGHYCQKDEENGLFNLLAGADTNKDQSYFLCQINQQQLSKILFPIGHLEKSEVRKLAHKFNLPTADKKDSQGLCFVGKVKLPTFLQQQLKTKPGKIIEISTEWDGYKKETPLNGHIYTEAYGKYKSEHIGAHFFTIGQRKGLELGGNIEPMFVIGTCTKTNIVYVGMGKNHPGLWRNQLYIINKNIHWLREDLELKENETAEYKVRVRYRQPLIKATLKKEADGLLIIFDQPISAIAPGQFAAWYTKNKLIGSGSIY